MIKWWGYKSDENSWEPEENLGSALIAKIKDLRENNGTEENPSSSEENNEIVEMDGSLSECSSDVSSDTNEDYDYGLDKGLIPEKILGKLLLISIFLIICY